ncbi:hypothetical protein D0466_02120 [Peribacillus glennii]|uniref:Uncharacterized protein n=1 Tax=Peribacillus glennii TaxID=2303991 RepID=A0A372LFJ3_9BACI|nr:hypothetical protein D0466_02120 [Peribacillus glennii]
MLFPVIAKPRSALGSLELNLIYSAEDFHLISENHVVQELPIPHKGDINYSFCE